MANPRSIARAICEEHPDWSDDQAFQEYKKRVSAAAADRIARRHRRMRTLVFEHYGTVCACPGCGATRDLTIDHVDGKGAEHRKELGIGGGWPFYAWLIREGFPEGYQALCRSCNASKGAYESCIRWH